MNNNPAPVIPPPPSHVANLPPSDPGAGMEMYGKDAAPAWDNMGGSLPEAPGETTPGTGESTPAAPTPPAPTPAAAPAAPAAPTPPAAATPPAPGSTPAQPAPASGAPAAPANLSPEQLDQMAQGILARLQSQAGQPQQPGAPAPAPLTPEMEKRILEEALYYEVTPERLEKLNSENPQERLAVMQDIVAGAARHGFGMARLYADHIARQSMEAVRREMSPAMEYFQTQQRERDRGDFYKTYPALAAKDSAGNLKYEKTIALVAQNLMATGGNVDAQGRQLPRDAQFKRLAEEVTKVLSEATGENTPLTPAAAPATPPSPAQTQTPPANHNTESAVPRMPALAESGRSKGGQGASDTKQGPEGSEIYGAWPSSF